MRGYTPTVWSGVKPKSEVTVMMYNKGYIVVQIGSIYKQLKADKGRYYTISFSDSGDMNDTVINIHGANLVQAIGDISCLYVGRTDFAGATRLRSIQIGSMETGYSNPNLTEVSFGTNKMLEYLYIQNCPNVEQSLDLTGCQALMAIRDPGERKRQLELLNKNKLSGICLGSQISQIMALVVPNLLDHYIKDKMGVKHYVRYMDDGIVLSDDKEFLHNLYDGMVEISKELGLNFNEKKTQIVKISKGITFMKIRHIITPTGKLVKKLHKSGIVRMRRKLKKFRKLVDSGLMTLDDVYNSFQSWIAHSYLAQSYKTRKNMIKLYNELFDGYRVTKKYEYIKGGKNGELLQTDKWHKYRWNCNID